MSFERGKDPKKSLGLEVARLEDFVYSGNGNGMDNGNYYDYINGSNVSDEEINEMIERGIAHIRAEILKGVKDPCFNSATGNTLVCGNAYLEKGGTYILYVNVTKSYYQQSKINVELNLNNYGNQNAIE